MTTAQVELGGVTGWVTDVIEDVGAWGVGGLIVLETVFPPIPSEVVLAFAGFSAGRGGVNGVLAWVAATLGSLVGAYLLYGLGAAVGHDRLHSLAGRRWFVLFSPRDLERGDAFFRRHGDRVVLLGRMVPVVRSVVSVPAGATGMPLTRFTVLTAIGSGLWNGLFIWAGYRLGDRWEDVSTYLQPIGYAVVAVLAMAVAASVARTVRRRSAGRPTR